MDLKEYENFCNDLAKKVVDESARATRPTIELAAQYGGPMAITSIMVHFAGSVMGSLATCLEVALANERKTEIEVGGPIEPDAFLFCCLLVAAGFGRRSEVAGEEFFSDASMMFAKIRGYPPSVPRCWLPPGNPSHQPKGFAQ